MQIDYMWKRLCSWYRTTFWSYEKQARYAGVKMGDHNFIMSHFWTSEPYLIEIGSHCQLTLGCHVYTHGGGSAIRALYPDFDAFGKIKIGDYVYVGNYALIMPGVTIGNNVIIGAGSIVTKSVPSNVVVAGNPAKILCSLEEYVQRNMIYNTSTKKMNKKDKRNFLLNLNEEKFIKKTLMKND